MNEDQIKTEYCKFTDRVARSDSLVLIFAKHIADMAVEELTKERDALKAQIDGGIRVYAETDGVFCDVELWGEESHEPNATLILDKGVEL